MLIGQSIYDTINAIKSPGHMSDTQSEFRPGLDYFWYRNPQVTIN